MAKELDSSVNYWSYEDLLDSMEATRVVEVSDDDYQGDTRVLLRDGDRFGVLTFGWGSCSGCDALQACDSVADATALRNYLWGQVQWTGDAGATAAWLREKDWEATYMSGERTRQFVAESLAALAGAV